MQSNFLKRIVEAVAGQESGQIVDLLSNKTNVNEFNIAKKLDLTINQTRNLLYRLSHMGILTSVRKKDKRKGWYIYFWTLNVLKSLEILEAKVEEELEKLEKEFKKRKSERFYKCKLCGGEVSEEQALIVSFMCSECGEVYQLSDSAGYADEIEKAIVKVKKDLELIKVERKQEQGKEQKKLTRLINKKEKEKKAKRAERAAERKKIREKEKRALEKAGKGKAKGKKLKGKAKGKAKKKSKLKTKAKPKSKKTTKKKASSKKSTKLSKAKKLVKAIKKKVKKSKK
jgi:transcription factor E